MPKCDTEPAVPAAAQDAIDNGFGGQRTVRLLPDIAANADGLVIVPQCWRACAVLRASPDKTCAVPMRVIGDLFLERQPCFFISLRRTRAGNLLL
jgi:hypothetical protein